MDTDTFHVDVADNRVGVGIDAPLRKLHIRENAAVGEGILFLTSITRLELIVI